MSSRAMIRTVVADTLSAANTRLVMWSEDGLMVFWDTGDVGYLEAYDSGHHSSYNKVGAASSIIIPDANKILIEWEVPIFSIPDVPNVFWCYAYETVGPSTILEPISVTLDGNSKRISKGTTISFRD